VSELGELLPKESVEKLNLPEDLVTYLTKSSRMEEYLYKDALQDIEDIYIYYSSFYIFDESHFSTLAVSALSRAYTLEKFYFYAKKIMDTSLEVESKGSSRENLVICVEQEKFEKLIDKLKSHYITLVDAMYEQQEVDLSKVHRTFGKIHLALEIEYDEYLEGLLDAGEKVLSSYIEYTQKEESHENDYDQSTADSQDNSLSTDQID